MTKLMNDRLDDALAPRSNEAFFNALQEADKKASTASFNELLAATAKTPSSFGSCVCGSEYSVADSRIVLGPMERHAAADAAAARYGMKASDSDVYYHQVQVIIDAINAHREQADRDFIADWYAGHAYCGDDL